MKSSRPLRLISGTALAVSLLSIGGRMAHAQQTAATVDSAVVPIRWERFSHPAPDNGEYRAGLTLLRNSARYNLGWIASTYKRDDIRKMLIVTHMDENGIRPPSSAAYGIAVLLKTGGFDPATEGVSEAEAKKRVAELIKGVAATHKVNGDPIKGWGDAWQSAFWTSLLGQAGWMLWDDLDDEGRTMLRRVVEHEANRFVAPGYRVPYWTAPDDHVNTPGDTKAEENAWNACVLQLALAMMPRHPNVAAWRHVGNELMISAFALKKDLQSNETLLEGKPVKSWLNGYNVRDDGAVINHHILHPDYMAAPTINMRTYLVQPLAGQPIFPASRLNADFVYGCYITRNFQTPEWKAPGGTIYRPGQAEVYYPTGTDWSAHRVDIYYLYDVFADKLHLDHDLPHPASDWIGIRAAHLAAMQARHPDGGLYSKGEFDTYAGREQLAIWQFGDALLLQWLIGQQAVIEPPAEPGSVRIAGGIK